MYFEFSAFTTGVSVLSVYHGVFVCITHLFPNISCSTVTCQILKTTYLLTYLLTYLVIDIVIYSPTRTLAVLLTMDKIARTEPRVVTGQQDSELLTDAFIYHCNNANLKTTHFDRETARCGPWNISLRVLLSSNVLKLLDADVSEGGI